MNLDLSNLLGGQGFTVTSQIAINGYSLPAQTLADSGADGLIFIDMKLAIQATQLFQVPTY